MSVPYTRPHSIISKKKKSLKILVSIPINGQRPKVYWSFYFDFFIVFRTNLSFFSYSTVVKLNHFLKIPFRANPYRTQATALIQLSIFIWCLSSSSSRTSDLFWAASYWMHSLQNRSEANILVSSSILHQFYCSLCQRLDVTSHVLFFLGPVRVSIASPWTYSQHVVSLRGSNIGHNTLWILINFCPLNTLISTVSNVCFVGSRKGGRQAKHLPPHQIFWKKSKWEKSGFYQILIPTIAIIFKNIFSYPDYYMTTWEIGFKQLSCNFVSTFHGWPPLGKLSALPLKGSCWRPWLHRPSNYDYWTNKKG
jgi:hypothetical protein